MHQSFVHLGALKKGKNILRIFFLTDTPKFSEILRKDKANSLIQPEMIKQRLDSTFFFLPPKISTIPAFIY